MRSLRNLPEDLLTCVLLGVAIAGEGVKSLYRVSGLNRQHFTAAVVLFLATISVACSYGSPKSRGDLWVKFLLRFSGTALIAASIPLVASGDRQRTSERLTEEEERKLEDYRREGLVAARYAHVDAEIDGMMPVQMRTLNAVAVQDPDEAEPETEGEAQRNYEDLAKDLAENVRSTLFVGLPGSGKSLLVSEAIKNLRKSQPNIQVWVIDPKADPSEAHYWTAVGDKYFPVRLTDFRDEKQDARIMGTIDNIVLRFNSVEGPKLLVIDEYVALSRSLPTKWVKRLFSGFHNMCAMGRSQQKYGWLLSQVPTADDFGDSASLLRVYRRVVLVSQKDKGLLQGNTQFFQGKPSPKLFGETGRVFWDSHKINWGILPSYTSTQDTQIESTDTDVEILNRIFNQEAVDGFYERLEDSDEKNKPNLDTSKIFREDGELLDIPNRIVGQSLRATGTDGWVTIAALRKADRKLRDVPDAELLELFKLLWVAGYGIISEHGNKFRAVIEG